MNAALLALLILLCSASSAAAEPISAAIGLTAALAGTGLAATTAAAVGGFLVSSVATVGVSLGLAALNKAMAPKPKAGDALSGTEVNVQLGGDIARQIPIGIVGAKGHLVYHNSYGQQHELYQQVFVLADWLCDGLASIYVNGKLCTLTGGPFVFGVAEYPGLISLTFQDGTQTTANSALISLSQPAGKWTEASKLTGMAYVYVLFTYAQGSPLYESGIPKLTFGLRGARLYDPRFDSTNGGSGAQRWADPATWAFSQNPAVAIYNYLLGFHRGGGSVPERILGMGVPMSDVLTSTVIAAANICDEAVTLDAGGTEARYRAACYLSADEGVTHAQTLEVLLSTMAGYVYDYGGFYYLQAGAGYTSTATITDDSLVTGAGVAFTAKRSRAELVNRIHGQWINPADEYQPTSYTPQISGVGIGEDYEELGRALDLNSVPSQFQAERIAQVRLREVRRQGTANITLGFDKLALQAGDWITWNSGRYGNSTWRIVNKAVDAIQQTVTIDLVETNANVYSWFAAEEGDPVTIGLPIVGAALITQPAAFTVQAVTLIDGSGNQQPGLKFGWTPITDPTVDAVVIEWRRIGTTIASRHADPTPIDGTFQTTDGVIGGIDYEARATISTTPSRVTTWTAWIAVPTVTPDTVFNVGSAVDAAKPIPTGLTLTSAIETLATGETQTLLAADWADVGADGSVTYEIDIKEGAGGYITFPTAHSNYQWRGLRSGTVVTARVRSVTNLGTTSGYSAEVTHTVATDAIPPGAITGFGGTASFQSMFLAWTNPGDRDFSHANLYMAPTNNRATINYTVMVPGPPGAVSTHTVTGVPPGTTRYFWVVPVDTSGNTGAFTPVSATGGLALTSQSIITADIAANAIDQTKFANNMQPVGIIASTAAAHTPNIDTALNTADGKLYRWNGSAWIASVPATDVTGTLTNAQIASIDAAKLTGQITSTQITDDAITTPKIAAGAVSTAELAAGAVTADTMAANAVTAGKIEAGAVTTAKLAAGAVTATQIATDTITAAQIAAGAINVSELAAKAVTTEKLAVGSRNVAFNAEFNVGPSNAPMSGWTTQQAVTGAAGTLDFGYVGFTLYAPAGFPAGRIHYTGTPGGVSFVLNNPVLFSGVAQIGYAVSAGNIYEASIALSVHRCSAQLQLQFWNAAGNTIVGTFGGNVVPNNGADGTTYGSVLEFPRSSVMATAPAGASFAKLVLASNYDGVSADPYTFFSAAFFAGTSASALTANGGQPAFAPYQSPGITIIERGQIKTGEVITEHMTFNTIDGDIVTTDTLRGEKIKAGSVITGSVKVSTTWGSDTTLNDTADRAERPVDFINAGATYRPRDTVRVLPGSIEVSGTTTLANWRDGGDLTQIAGGAIAANTIAANKVKVGVRGLEVRGLAFEMLPPAATSNAVTWTGGNITYIDDSGSPQSININSNYSTYGSAVSMAAGYCIYWTKGSVNLSISPSVAGVTGGENVIMMIYNGGGAKNVLYGGTIIDGTSIQTGSVHADRIEANSITAAQVLQSAELITNSATIRDLTVTTLKVADGHISAVYAAFNGSTANNSNVFPPAIAALAGRRFLVAFVVNDVAAARIPTDTRGVRLVTAYVQRGGVDTALGSSWTYDAVTNIVAVNNYASQFPAIVGQFIYSVPADDSYIFLVRNLTGLATSIAVAVTELKR